MASLVSQSISAPRARSSRRVFSFGPLFDSVSAVLLPALAALMISAAVVGHGHISGASIVKVLDMMTQALTLPAVSP